MPDLRTLAALEAASRVIEDANLTVDAAPLELQFRRSLLRRLFAGRLNDVDATQAPDPMVYQLGEHMLAHPTTAAKLRAKLHGKLR